MYLFVCLWFCSTCSANLYALQYGFGSAQRLCGSLDRFVLANHRCRTHALPLLTTLICCVRFEFVLIVWMCSAPQTIERMALATESALMNGERLQKSLTEARDHLQAEQLSKVGYRGALPT